jgi:AAA+ superfamily predicted ATPase
MSNTVGSPLLDSIKDLLKYKIVSSVNTGDKNLDNLINAFLLIILTIIFTPGLQYKIFYYVSKMLSKCIKQKLSKTNYGSFQQYIILNHGHFYKTTWSLLDHNNSHKLTKAISQHIIRNYSWIFDEGGLFKVDFNGNKTINKNTTDFDWYVIEKLFTPNLPYPIFTSGKEILAIQKTEKGCYFVHSNDSILKEFIKTVNDNYVPEVTDEKKKDKKETRITINGNTGAQSTIYPDRTFDKLVTRHKKAILNMLDNFLAANKPDGKSAFNGMGTYNLGILFYGPPGTGKTSFIKAICNYVHRDAILIDMRNIKTMKDLTAITDRHCEFNSVYVLDEFDCVQDLLQRKPKNSREEARELQSQINQLLGVKASATAGSVTTGIDDQIKEIREKIKILESQLNLENMLTWMDGTVEMRNRIIIAATNHIERIDSALLRDGRFDKKICLDEFTNDEVKEILTLMYGDKYRDLINSYKYVEKKFTPAKILNIATQHDDIKSVIDELTREPEEYDEIKTTHDKIE